MSTITTYIVVKQDGGRFFCDDLEAAKTVARAWGMSIKGVYKAVLQVVAWEEVENISLQVEPDWDLIAEQARIEVTNANREIEGEDEDERLVYPGESQEGD
jgi:hypothetical protein